MSNFDNVIGILSAHSQPSLPSDLTCITSYEISKNVSCRHSVRVSTVGFQDKIKILLCGYTSANYTKFVYHNKQL